MLVDSFDILLFSDSKQSSSNEVSSSSCCSSSKVATPDLSAKFPWLKPKCYSLTIHHGRLLDKKIMDKIYTLSDPEIKIIVPPHIDFDPGNVLKMGRFYYCF